MNAQFFVIPLQFQVLMTCIAINGSLPQELSPRLILFNATRVENDEFELIEFNCSSSRQSIGNGAEFIVNGLTVEHISFNNNKCYNRKMQECLPDICQCFQRDNLYIYKHKGKILPTELIVGCQMRFVDNKTSTIIKSVMSLKFNGTVSVFYQNDVKILKQDTENNTDENENNMDHIYRWLPALCGGLIVIFAVSIIFVCHVLKNRQIQEKQDPELETFIPRNIRDQINQQIKDWKKQEKMFVHTRASEYILQCLQHNSCVTLTAPTGAGKSFISRQTALVFQKKGYEIILVYFPTDIRDYYQPGKMTVFVIDDICGNFTANQHQVDSWKQLLPVINTILADKFCKIIVCCRLQVYKDDKFNMLTPFKSCECNLTSNELCLTVEEKVRIANLYIGKNWNNCHELILNYDFLPLLCSLYLGKKYGDVEEFLENVFQIYKNELDSISVQGLEGGYQMCSLALIVLNNNQLEDKWFEEKKGDKSRTIEDVCEACAINRHTPIQIIKRALVTLDGTFILKHNGTYRTVHDTLFDFLVHYFGKKMIECLINHGDSYLVHERIIWLKSPDKKNDHMHFIIDLPDSYLESYLERLIKDWSAGMVAVVFRNTNMKVSSFRQRLLQKLKRMDRPQQETLTKKTDTVIPKEDFASGNTPLIMSCYHGHTDMMQWMLQHDIDVDQYNDDGATGLSIASQEGHTDIVKLLLVQGPNVDICDEDGCSPLYLASEKGHTEIVRLLLEQNPNVDQCNIDGFTPVIQSCSKNQTSIVKLLLGHKANVNAQAYDGGNALYFSVCNGNEEITRLLLANNADCNICIQSKQSMTNTFSNHPDNTLDMAKQSLCDSLVRNTSSHVTDYVSEKSEEYIWGVVAGSSPLHIACFMGRNDEVCCLLDYDANVNMTKEDGTTPFFYACEVGHEYIVRLLLDKGADTRICRVDGKSPINIAIDNGHHSIVCMVKEHMKEDKLSK